MNRPPMKIAVFGTGSVGKAVIKLAARRSDVELVGARVYSAAKNGLDLGTIAGIEPLGVIAYDDPEMILAHEPDCILYAPMDFGNFSSDEELLDLLKRGQNVVTTLGYQNVDARGEEVAALFGDTARAGGGTLTGTGVNPGFMPERLAMAATGATAEIHELRIEEYLRIGNEPQATLNVFGFGLPEPASGEKPLAAVAAEQMERQFILSIAEHFGTPVTELRYTPEWHLAPRDIQTSTMTIAQGTVAYVVHEWEAITDGGPVIRFRTNWYISDDARPAGLPCDDYYRITIEGRPSLTIGVELRGSALAATRMYPGDDTEPVYYLTAATMIQAVPGAMSGEPGVRRIQPPSNSHWRADLRDALDTATEI